MNFSSLLARIRAFFIRIGTSLRALWKRFRALKIWQQIAAAIVLAVLLIGGVALATHNAPPADTTNDTRTVTVESISSLSGNGDSVSIVGNVRSVTEADILAQSGGTVTSVHTSVGKSVPAGFVIAEVQNASERASVLQAEGAYDAALASRNVTSLQAGNSAQSLSEAATSARNTYRTTYTALDTVINTDIDTFFGSPTPYGPNLLINPGPTQVGSLSRARSSLTTILNTWRDSLSTVDSRDPNALLDSAETNLRTVSAFLTTLASAANATNSRATPTQIAALAEARATIDGLLSSVSAARDAYNSKKSAAAVGQTQSQSTSNETASADASVKQALGGLRAAQASLEKTVIRAPIGGTINFLPIHVGDYVAPLTHVATVAQNGALEIVAYISEDNRDLIAAGDSVMVEGTYKGIVTSVAPALDPTTKQIEVHVAVDGSSKLVNGQSVRIALPNAAPKESTATTTTVAGPILLPLTAVKLSTDERVVFTVDESGVLVAHKVEIGEVRGDRIEITTGVTPDMRIVTDARGLSEGQKVTVAAAGS